MLIKYIRNNNKQNRRTVKSGLTVDRHALRSPRYDPGRLWGLAKNLMGGRERGKLQNLNKKLQLKL